MRKVCAYLKADLKRMLCTVQFPLSVALAVAVLLIATLEEINLNTDVLYVFTLVMYGMPAMIILVCGAVASADIICEDTEHKYIMQEILRGDIKTYLSAKILSIFLTTLLSTALALFLFANLLHIRLAWSGECCSQQYENLLRSGSFRSLLKNRNFEMYFSCYALQYGILSGILSLWAAYLSMFISNRMLVLSAPMLLYFFTDFFLAKLFTGSVYLALIFSPAYNLFSNDLLSALLVFGIAIGNLLLIWNLMIWKTRRDLYG